MNRHELSNAQDSPRLLLVVGAALIALTMGPTPALADDVNPKRAEGRYYVEFAEIMMRTTDFDIIIGRIDEGGPRAGADPVDIIAEMPSPNLEAPMVEMGLNRASGKSSFSLTVFDFDMRDQRFPQDFETKGNVITSTLLPADITFQHQNSGRTLDDQDNDYLPNVGNDYGYRVTTDFQMADFDFSHNIWEKENMRFRWNAGIRYAQLDQSFGVALSFYQEAVADGAGGTGLTPTQDFFFARTDASTQGLGPKLGLEGRIDLGEKKKWRVEADVDVAMLPESTAASYGVNFQDREVAPSVFSPAPGINIIRFAGAEVPLIPGLSSLFLGNAGIPFSAEVKQSDFTEVTWLTMGKIGIHYQANRTFSVGLDAWGMRWHNVLSASGVFETARDHSEYEIQLGTLSGDPQLLDTELILRVPRFTKRDSFSFDGLVLNLGFQF